MIKCKVVHLVVFVEETERVVMPAQTHTTKKISKLGSKARDHTHTHSPKH